MTVAFTADFHGADRNFAETPVRGPGADVHNAGAIDLFRLLGFLGDHVEPETVLGCPIPPEEVAGGACDAGDFLGRVLLAEALLSSSTDDAAGRDGYQTGPGSYAGGRSPGYLARHLKTLADVARHGMKYGTQVTWG